MKRYLLLALCSVLSFFDVLGQSPYSLSPRWTFGYYAGMDFTGGAPVFSSVNKSETAEATTSVCDPTGALVLYSPSSSIWSATGASAALSCGSVGGNSSTNGSVSFPVPGDLTYNKYFFVTATDNTGGQCGGAGNGIEYMTVTRAGAALSFTGKTTLANASDVNESLCVGSDRSGGYWVVSHGQNNQLWVWHFTSAAAPTLTKITVPTSVALGISITGGSSNGSIKFSQCQDKIGWYSNGYVQVYHWDNSTGTLGAEVISKAAAATVCYGFEFSPDGSKAYYTSLTPASLNQINLTSPFTTTNLANSSSNNSAELGTMQLGPDNKVYVVNGAFYPTSYNLGVINTPNAAAGAAGYNASGFTMPTTAAPNGFAPFAYRGISNIAWLSPQKPVISATATGTCNIYNFSFVFKNYFNVNIPVNNASITWNWGDASSNTTANAAPSHSFPTTGGPYTVTLSFTDASCGQLWTTTIPIAISCPAPVELIDFTGIATGTGADLLWQTAMEVNNDYFEVQRSLDGIHFQSIHKEKGAGHSSQVLSYYYKDGGVSTGVVYYRLSQHDFDGTQTYSKVIAVRFDRTGAVAATVSPNPFSSSFVVTKAYEESATILVYDIYGRLLEQKNTSAGESKVTLGETLVHGSYLVHYVTEASSITIQVEKQ